MKKILAFTLALAMVLSTWTSTFAASKEVEALANLKLLLNTTDAEVNADLTRAVGLAMVLKALGYTQEDANAKMAENTFVDLDKAAWAKGFAKLGEDLKITNGTSVEPKLFSPNWKLNERAFVAFLLRALGHDVDAAWAKAGELAKENGLTETVSENKLTKGEAAVIMYKALKAKVQGDEKGRTLAQKLVDEKKLDKELAVANGLLNAEPEMVEVVSAETDNVRQLTVKFNGSLDKDSAENVKNYKLAKTSKAFGKAELVEANTVVLTLKGETTSFDNKKEMTLVVSGVKNLDKKEMKKQELAFTPVDVTYPTVKDITVTGPRNLKITFSEPVRKVTAGTTVVTVKHGNATVPTKAVKNSNSDENVVEVELYHNLKDGQTYVVAVGNPKTNASYVYDFANYPNVYVEKDLEYAFDKVAPEASVVKADQKVVVVEFTKPVSGLTKEHFYHTYTGYKAKEIYKKDELKAENKLEKTDVVSKVWVKFYDTDGHPLPAGNASFTVLTEANKSKIMDNWKNEFKTMTYTLEIVADREAPVVNDVEVTGEKTFKIKFNESVKNVEVKNLVLTDAAGKEVEKNKKITLEDNNKTAKVELSKSYAGKTLNLTVKGVKDASLYENTMTEYSTSLEFGDKTFAGPSKVEFRRFKKADYSTDVTTAHADNTIGYELVLTFDENVVEAATNKDNYGYRLGKDATTAVSKLSESGEFFGNYTNVVILPLTVAQATALTSDADHKTLKADPNKPYLIINDKVTDLVGNTVSAFDSVKDITPYSAVGTTIKADSVKAVAHDKIEFEFDSAVDSIDLGDFSIHGDPEYKFYTYDFDGSKKVTLYVSDAKKLPADPSSLKLDVKADAKSIDAFGKSIAASSDTLVVKDGITPSISALKLKANVQSNDVDTEALIKAGETALADNVDKAAVVLKFVTGNKKALVTIKYTEAIDKDSISNTTYKLGEGYKFLGFDAVNAIEQTPANTADGTVEIVVEVTKDLLGTEVSADDFKDLTIIQNGSIKDANGNVKAASSDAVPVIVVTQ